MLVWIISRGDKARYTLTVDGCTVQLNGLKTFFKSATEAVNEAYETIRLFESMGYVSCLMPSSESEHWS